MKRLLVLFVLLPSVASAQPVLTPWRPPAGCASNDYLKFNGSIWVCSGGGAVAGGGTSGRSTRWSAATTLANGAFDDDGANATARGSIIGNVEDAVLAWDAGGNNRIGFVKKSGAFPKIAYGSATDFAIAQSSGATIAAAGTFTDKITISAAGAIGLVGNTTVTGNATVTNTFAAGDVASDGPHAFIGNVTMLDNDSATPTLLVTMNSGTGAERTVAQFDLEGAGGQLPAIALSSNGAVGVKLVHSNSFLDANMDNSFASAANVGLAIRGSRKFNIESTGHGWLGDTTYTSVDNNVTVLDIGNTGAGQTVTNNLINATNTGTYNTTSGGIVVYGVASTVSATESAGGNVLQNVALYGSATNSDDAIGLWIDNGRAQFDSNVTIAGLATIGDAVTDDGHIISGTTTIKDGATSTDVSAAGTILTLEQADATHAYLTFRGTTQKGLVFNNSTSAADGYVLYDQTARSVTIAAAQAVHATVGGSETGIRYDSTTLTRSFVLYNQGIDSAGDGFGLQVALDSGGGAGTAAAAFDVMSENSTFSGATADGALSIKVALNGTLTERLATNSVGYTTLTSTALVAGFQSGAAGLKLVESATAQINIGAGIEFHGAYNGTATTEGALIKLMKDNGSGGDFGFDLVLGTRPNGGSLTPRLEIDTTGALYMGDAGRSSVANNLDILTIGQTGTGQTGNGLAVAKVLNTGSYSTAGGNITYYGGIFATSATESAGSNTLTGIALYSSAVNGDDPVGLWVDDGRVALDGDTTIGASGAAVLNVNAFTTFTSQSGGINVNGSIGLIETSGDIGGHIIVDSSAASQPAVSSCGTDPSVSGNDTAGIVTIGSGTATSCTVTFDNAFSGGTPACVISSEITTRGDLVFSAKSSTAFTITSVSGANMAGGKFDYVCIGTQDISATQQ